MSFMWPELGAAAGAASAVMYYAVGLPSSQLFGPALVRAAPDAGAPRVALTFDDGPSESTEAVLEALAQYGARATFFLVGSNSERLPGVARRVAQEGHEIGNHTYSHPAFYLRTPRQIAGEIGRCQRALESVLGLRPKLFRPPYGVRWFGLFPALEHENLRVVMWSVTGFDWKRPSDWVTHRVLRRARDGDVVLLHDGDTTVAGDRRQETVRALRAILPALAERGLRAVTVSELFGLA